MCKLRNHSLFVLLFWLKMFCFGKCTCIYTRFALIVYFFSVDFDHQEMLCVSFLAITTEFHYCNQIFKYY